MSIEDIIRESSVGKARTVTGADALRVLRGFLGEETGRPKSGLPEEFLRATNCGNPDCELHGDLNAEQPYRITDEDLDVLSAEDAFTHMISATGSAHNALLAGKSTAAMISQTQALLWERIASRLEKAELQQRLAQGQVPPQDDLSKDAPLQPPFGE